MDFFGQNDMYLANRENYLRIIDETLKNQSFLRGDALIELEEKVANICDRKYAIVVNSGTDALFIALKALGIKKGDEVIVPSFSFIASATPILMLGATPIFIDIDKETCLANISKIEEKITKKTKGIIIVDIFGECPDYKIIQNICKKYKIFYLEDAAQAFGSSFLNKKAGSFGDVSIFSFDVSKIVYGISTGGMILTDNPEIAKHAALIRGHGFDSKKRDFVCLGVNSQMSTVNAALISYSIDLEHENFTKRQEIRKAYDTVFKELSNVTTLKRDMRCVGNNHKYVIFIKNNRDGLINFLAKKNIPVKVHYERPIPGYSNIIKHTSKCLLPENAYEVSNTILSLPIHPYLSKNDVEIVCSNIEKFFEHDK